MKALLSVVAILSSLSAAPVNARTRFEPYEARNSIVEGQGGSRTTTDGVDFWTTGDPPRRYQVIGIIRDNRGTGLLHGNAVGSTGIAKKVREVGGDAVIMINQNTSIKGIWSQGQASYGDGQAFGSTFSVPIRERMTTFFVVKYLSENQPQAAEQSPANSATAALSPAEKVTSKSTP